jgi:hypothetical protein
MAPCHGILGQRVPIRHRAGFAPHALQRAQPALTNTPPCCQNALPDRVPRTSAASVDFQKNHKQLILKENIIFDDAD